MSTITSLQRHQRSLPSAAMMLLRHALLVCSLLLFASSVSVVTAFSTSAGASASLRVPSQPISAAAATIRTRRTRAILAAGTSQTETESSSKPRLPKAVGKVVKQTAALDGAEWISVRNRLLQQHQQQSQGLADDQDQPPPPSYARTVMGVFAGITGSVNGKRVVGMQVLSTDQQVPSSSSSSSSEETVTLDQDETVQLYKESVAQIPDGVSEDTAVWTLVQSLSAIHCVLPVLQNIGGSDGTENRIVQKNGKVVVMGANDLAVAAAEALQKLDCQVTLVSAEKPNGLSGTIRHLTPAVGELQLGFASVIDQFDSILDTLGDQQEDGPGNKRASVTGLLQEKHGCQTYVSLQTESQDLIVEHGLLWGPAKSKEHINKLQSRAGKAVAAQFPSPTAFGATVQALLEQGVTFAAPPSSNQKSDTNNVHVRGWSLKDFWDYTTWPREAGTNIPFGLPFPDDDYQLKADDYQDDDDNDDDDDDEDDDAPMISAPPMPAGEISTGREVFEEEEEEVGNPYVLGVRGVKGLQEKIVEDEATCILFVSAPFCRTCRYLKPQYQRLARKYTETAADKGEPLGVVFVKAEAAGLAGKELGRALGVETVPSFLLFKNGRRYGEALTISRLPSKKLELAIKYLQEDKEWDEAAFSDDDKRGFEGGSGRGRRDSSKLR